MNVLITGGSGMVGGRFASRIAREHDVKICDLKNAIPDAACTLVEDADLLNRKSLIEAAEGADLIVHLAAVPRLIPDRKRLYEVNVTGTFNVMEAAGEVNAKGVIFASSICTYGAIFTTLPLRPSYLPIDEAHPTEPDDLYGLSKLLGEEICRAYASRFGIGCICLRFATIWAPDPSSEHIQRYVESTRREEMGADRYWAYVDLRDAVEALRLALCRCAKQELQFEIYNIGAGEIIGPNRTRDLIERYYPSVGHVDTDALSQKPDAPLYSIEKARQILNYQPRFDWKEYANMKLT